MGGGDLNLKKSWHPSTMKNMEKVWKAEQQKHQEKKRIAELKKEIEMEKDREDITKYAMEQGVIEKKDEKKLDWMYKGPNQMVNREEYLLGRPIDKSFEQLAQAERNAEINQAPKNHVEYECIPPSLRFFSGNEQVDLARKMQEDPLYAIKKKEMETRSQLLKNPVKLKQLKELLEQQSKKCKNKKSKKRKSKHKYESADSDDEAALDNLLAAKYKQLKDKINEKELLRSMKKLKRKRKKSKKHSQDSSSDSDSSSNDSSNSESDDNSKLNIKKKKKSEDKESRKRYNESLDTRKLKNDADCNKKQNREYDNYQDRRFTHKLHKFHRNRENIESDSKERYYERNKHRDERQTERKWQPKRKAYLTEEEKERRRQEMMANATWRDKERQQNIKKYHEEEKKEGLDAKMDNKDFIRKQLAAAAEVGTVASRIKANINNIQRSGRAMDTNFAKR